MTDRINKRPTNIRIASGTVNQTPLDWDGNVSRILEVIKNAKSVGADLLVLPELCICGYGCEDTFHSPDHSQQSLECLSQILPETKDIILVIGMPFRLADGLYNTAAFVSNGKILGIHAKQNLAGDGVHYEPRWFRAWEHKSCTQAEALGQKFPFGEVVLDLSGVRIAAEICEDAWVPDRPATRYARVGTDLIVCPTASHFAFGKSETRKRISAEASRMGGCLFTMANLLGNESGRVVFDGQLTIHSHGDLLAEGQRFSYEDSELIYTDANLEILQAERHRIFSLYNPDESIHIKRCEFEWKHQNGSKKDVPKFEASVLTKEEEFTYAVSLAMFDYMRKSRSNGFVVSLSGGADSAACAMLSMHSIQLAKTKLGAQKLTEKLSYLNLDSSKKCGGLLDCVYQGTKNSSDVTRKAAEKVAQAIDAKFSCWDIDGLVEKYRNLLEDHIGEDLTWEKDDITLQNIQSRVRAPGVWMLANKRNALLLATGNRSESAVGYSTMDGDTAGSISPIAGIDKHFLLHWLKWMETKGTKEIGPIKELSAINEQQPTAELRPLEMKQTDEADLMPYDLLNAIEILFVRDKLSPLKIKSEIMGDDRFKEINSDQLSVYIERFFRLWSRNQWKRERYAPSFHLDDESLDPKSWCRFPILNGNFKRELDELKDKV